MWPYLLEGIKTGLNQAKFIGERSPYLGYALLAACACLVYVNSLHNPFHYDDFHSIVHNERLRSLEEIPRFFVDPTAFSSEPENAMYRPLLLLTFAVNFAVSGYQTWSYHLLSLAIHVGCVLLVMALGRRLLGGGWGAWWAALLFAVHPINSESLNYISSRSEIMAALPSLLACWLFLQIEQRGRWAAIGTVVAYALALLSKSVSIVIPAVLLVYVLLLERRWCREWTYLFSALGGVALLYIAGIWTFFARATLEQPVRGFDEQFWTQCKALIFYAKMLLWPEGLSVDHQFLISDSLFDPIAASAFVCVGSLLFLAFYHVRRHPLPAFFLVWFLVTLAPSSLVPLNVLVNEHRLYVPGIAFCWSLGYGLDRLREKWVTSDALLAGMAVVIALAMAWTTFQRNAVWSSPLTLWRSAALNAPLMARPYMYWGEALEKEGHSGEAIAAYRHALRRDPGFAAVYYRLGMSYLTTGQNKSAVDALSRGTEVDPVDGAMWASLGEALRGMGRWDESLQAYQRAALLLPQDSAVLNNLGNTYQVLNQPQRALEAHMSAVKVTPDDAQTQVNLGNAFTMLGQHKEALQAFRRAVELDSTYAGAWLSLASALEKVKQVGRAIEAYERAAELDEASRAYAHSRMAALRGVTGE